jgi:hypothetical protein
VIDLLQIDSDYATRVLGNTPKFWDDERRRKIGKQIADYLRETVIVRQFRERIEQMTQIVAPN